MSFEMMVVEYPAKQLTGMKCRSSMQSASTDCGALWQTFGPRMGELSGGGCGCECGCTGAFGISLMHDETGFDYWAAVEAKPGTPVPEGMGTIEIPAGVYAKCSVSGLAQLGDAYKFVYGVWASGNTEYTLRYDAPCFEWYPPNWQPTDLLEIFAPVRKI